MGSLKRQMQRKNKMRQHKDAKKTARQVENQVNSMPKVCGECGIDFDNTNKEMLNQWRIAVWDDGRINLSCPDCGPTEEEIEAGEKKADSGDLK